MSWLSALDKQGGGGERERPAQAGRRAACQASSLRQICLLRGAQSEEPTPLAHKNTTRRVSAPMRAYAALVLDSWWQPSPRASPGVARPAKQASEAVWKSAERSVHALSHKRASDSAAWHARVLCTVAHLCRQLVRWHVSQAWCLQVAAGICMGQELRTEILIAVRQVTPHCSRVSMGESRGWPKNAGRG